ncbi:MAG: CPBP family glutamic-type intramembrane protease [Burkholderiales bacterium]
MVQDARVSLPVVVSMAMINGTYEEVFLLGFLLRGLRQFGFSLTVGVPLLIRVLYHLYQGPVGAMWILGFGLLFSLYYFRFRLLCSNDMPGRECGHVRELIELMISA